MDTNQWLIVLAVGMASGAAAWAAAMWSYGRKLAASVARVHKLEKARQIAFQKTSQARKQLAQLQEEIAELRQTAGQAATVTVENPPKPAPSRRHDNLLMALDAMDRRELPPQAFAETQVMQPMKRH